MPYFKTAALIFGILSLLLIQPAFSQEREIIAPQALPSPFSPNGDLVKDNCTISFVSFITSGQNRYQAGARQRREA